MKYRVREGTHVNKTTIHSRGGQKGRVRLLRGAQRRNRFALEGNYGRPGDLGLGLAGMASSAMKIPFVLDLTIVLMAFGFSALVGIVFGFFPARHAARLNPIEALRHE